ncbi:RNA helicase [Hydrogenophaga crassostreae]|uniref:RNA helicase n=1 Tax=Hydrogenophaga crassostreae TaxID=1763535 RepID=A0A167IFB2_9BURK|nr:DEAD/DEAH box helicase [Hydrogenophaga crassostreae]AOW13200.1 RNA helicase [Hydrogenophaga crassostreae]OAD42652.1 RNA helicase [Hydrogenophaga crassostreae]
MPFTSLGLAPSLAQAAANLGFTAPTPIQAEAMPIVLRGDDLLATAQTGSGKTAAFALPLLQRWLSTPPTTGTRPLLTLVLVPTRELAAQVGEVFRSLAEPLTRRPKIVVAFGGVSINPQMMALRGGADIVVATPGRLLDLIDNNALKLGSVQHLVLDEADRLLDLGFADELGRLLAQLPPRRQTLFFSATFAPAVETLANSMLQDPERVEVPVVKSDVAVIEQRVFEVDDKRRTQLLRQLIKDHGWERVLVFVSSQYAAEHLAAKLHKNDVFATSFHGGLSQGARKQTLQEFKEKRWDVLVTTDLASRGLHIDQLPVVVNFDLPRSADDYTHRIGRTGRAGESGLAISFVTAASAAHWRVIEKRQGLSLPREQYAGFEPIETEPAGTHDPEGTGGIKGKRPSKKDKLRAATAAQKPND